MRTDVGVVISDTHCLASTGLLTPEAVNDEGARITLNKAQTWLWKQWQATLQRAETELQPIHGGKRWFIHLGDMLEGLHHDSTQVATLNTAAMRRITAQTLRPWVKWSDYTFLLRGTPAHGGQAGADEESVAELLDAQEPHKVQKDLTTGMATTFHRRIEIGGAVFDVAHHPPSGTGREYLAHGPAGVLAMSVVLDHALTGAQPPDVALRGHLHPKKRCYDSGLTYPTRGIICPAWKLLDEFGAKRTPGAVNVVGALFFTVMGGQIQLWPVIYTPKRSKAWTEGEVRSTTTT